MIDLWTNDGPAAPHPTGKYQVSATHQVVLVLLALLLLLLLDLLLLLLVLVLLLHPNHQSPSCF